MVIETVVFFRDKRSIDHSLPQMIVGIDQEQWRIGPKFRGFKLVTPGLHIITTNIMNSVDQCGMTTSIILWIDHKSITLPTIVLEYDIHTEDWTCSTDAFTVTSIKEQYILWDNFLAAYSPLNNQAYSQPITLNSLIDICHNSLKFYHPNEHDNHQVFKIDSATRLHFPQINLHNSYPPNSIPSMITKYSLDKSYLLKQKLELFSVQYLLSCVSISFMVFLYSQNLDGLDFWKTCFCMICYSEEILSNDDRSVIPLFISWMHLVSIHLGLLDASLSDPLTQSFFCSIDENNVPWIWNALTTLFMNIDDTISLSNNDRYNILRNESINFQKQVEQIFHISLSRSHQNGHHPT